MHHFIAKIRFQLGKLVPKLLSEGQKLRFRALEIQTFIRGAYPRTFLGGSWLPPPPNIHLQVHCVQGFLLNFKRSAFQIAEMRIFKKFLSTQKMSSIPHAHNKMNVRANQFRISRI